VSSRLALPLHHRLSLAVDDSIVPGASGLEHDHLRLPWLSSCTGAILGVIIYGDHDHLW